ncbi:SusC/RagA family TonB-linked outer membrane protein [Bacteroidia bacterium]|nr:SusC/RagA family TonB-linked outer membrane protein [Bacteroidia bacterium]
MVEKGNSKNGVATDLDGKFSLQVSPNATLEVSYLGYATQSVAVNGKTTVNVTLAQDAANLDEVVVVGYGSQKKANLTGSVASVGASKLESRAMPNLSTGLTGLAAGVSVRQSSGNPGSDGANIRIRGIGTFNNDYRGPIVIIDGAEADLNSVNPEDVESISLLKDAASASIYGSRGANGVVLVTTKKGKKGAAPKVTYTGIFTQEKASSSIDFLWDYASYMELYNKAELASNPSISAQNYSQANIDAWRAGSANPNGTYTDPNGNQIPNWLAFPNTNWSEILFAPNYSQKHNVSVSGGGENSTYLLSLGYFENPGTLENTGIDQFNMRINVESKITNFLKIGTHTYAVQRNKEPGDVNQMNTYRFQTIGAINPFYDGKYGAPESPEESSSVMNPIKNINATGGKQTTTRINTTWFADVDIWQGLSARASINYQNYFYDSKTYAKNLDAYSFRTGLITIPGTTLETAQTSRTANRNEQYTANALLNYNKTFGDHDVSAMLGYEQFYYNTSGFNATKMGLLDFGLTDITTATEMVSIGGDVEQEYAMVSYIGRLNYAYKSRYLFEANFRRDASSRFSPDYRVGVFPSFSAGWRVSEEDFFAPAKDIVNNLKLRASWGKLGNTTSGYYDWQATYGKVNNVLDGGILNGLAVTKLANSLLQWEKINSADVGLDAAFLNSRLNLELDYYNRTTEGILYNPASYLTVGIATAPYQNTADMLNSGLEMTLGWNDKIGDVHYAVSGNFAYNNNEITKYRGVLEQGWVENADGTRTYKTNIGDVTTGGGETGSLRVEGHLMDEYYLRNHYRGDGSYYNGDGSVNPNGGPKDGMIRTDADLQWVRDMLAYTDATGKKIYTFDGATVNQNGGLWKGEYLFADNNGDGNYGNSNDRQFTGKSSAPKYTYGFSASADWKGIDFSMTWAGAGDFYYYLHERGVNQNYLGGPTNVLPIDAATKFYRDDNVNAPYARLRTGSGGAYRENTQFLYDASYLKLKNLQVGYTLPKAWMSKAHIAGLRVFLSGENLLTITDYPGVDPEIGGAVNVYPIARLLSAGINLTF